VLAFHLEEGQLIRVIIQFCVHDEHLELQIVFLTELMIFASASVMGVGVRCIVMKAKLRFFTVPNPVFADIHQIRWGN
jgi:hypothetical protein